MVFMGKARLYSTRKTMTSWRPQVWFNSTSRIHSVATTPFTFTWYITGPTALDTGYPQHRAGNEVVPPQDLGVGVRDPPPQRCVGVVLVGEGVRAFPQQHGVVDEVEAVGHLGRRHDDRDVLALLGQG